MAEEIKLIAKRTRLMRQRLDDLWIEAGDDLDKLDAIYEQISDLDREIMRLISINIRDRGVEYDNATAALGTANRKLGTAIKDINRFVEAIEAVANAIGLIARVLPA